MNQLISHMKWLRLLGKSKLETFFRISLPLAKTGIIIGITMSWVRAVGELGATMMMAYNPHTISIQIFEDNAIGGLTSHLRYYSSCASSYLGYNCFLHYKQ